MISPPVASPETGHITIYGWSTRCHLCPGERETGLRVFTGFGGHPFCIVFGRHGTG